MCGSMVDIQSATAEITRGKRKKKKPQDENIMSASATQGGHKKQMPLKTSTSLCYATPVGNKPCIVSSSPKMEKQFCQQQADTDTRAMKPSDYGKTQLATNNVRHVLDHDLKRGCQDHIHSVIKTALHVCQSVSTITSLNFCTSRQASVSFKIFMVALCNRADHYIFSLLFLSSSSIFFFFLA